jgi:hypothetical protein
VMVRPCSAMLAFAEAMNAEVLAVQRELGVEAAVSDSSPPPPTVEVHR